MRIDKARIRLPCYTDDILVVIRQIGPADSSDDFCPAGTHVGPDVGHHPATWLELSGSHVPLLSDRCCHGPQGQRPGGGPGPKWTHPGNGHW